MTPYFYTSKALLLCALLSAQLAYAGPYLDRLQKAACEFKLQNPQSLKSYAAWAPLKELLDYGLSHQDQVIGELSEVIPQVTRKDVLSIAGGGGNGRAYRVQTQDGIRALKIWNNGPIHVRAQGVVVQLILGEIGLAPKVRGLLLDNKFQKFMGTHGDVIIPTSSKTQSALLMDYVHNAKLYALRRFKYDMISAAAVGRPIIGKGLLERLPLIDLAYRFLLIRPGDEQAVVPLDGSTPYLIDFDRYKVVVGTRYYSMSYPQGLETNVSVSTGSVELKRYAQRVIGHSIGAFYGLWPVVSRH